MLNKTRKGMRIFTVMFLVIAMAVTLVVPASAAGVETWYAGYVLEGGFNLHGYNYTPTKTMGVSGTLSILANFTITDSSSYSTPAHCVLEIRDSYTGATLARDEANISNHSSLGVAISITQGQKIYLYMGVYDSSSGVARTAYVQYSHYIY